VLANTARESAFTAWHVVCRETQAEAEGYTTAYALHQGRSRCVDTHIAGKRENRLLTDKDTYDRYRQRFAGGAGSYPWSGPREDRLKNVIRISQRGYAGIALLVCERNHLRTALSSVDGLPLLRDCGLRSLVFEETGHDRQNTPPKKIDTSGASNRQCAVAGSVEWVAPSDPTERAWCNGDGCCSLRCRSPTVMSAINRTFACDRA